MTAVAIRHWKPVFIAALAATTVAGLGSLMTDLGPWYINLRKPSWQPPEWLFGPAWTLIFGLCALSGIQAWRDAPSQNARKSMLILFALNGFLNVTWSALFFRFHRPDWALYEVVLLWLSIALLIVTLARYSKTASLLAIPYLAWVSFAAVLNFAVVTLNSPFH